MTTLGLLLIAAIAVIGAFLSRPAITVSTNPNSGLSVSGTGKVSVVPDTVIFNAGIMAQGTTVAEAQKKASDVTDQIKKALAALKIDKQDIKTANYSINPIYASQTNIPKIRAYEVQHNLSIKLHDLTLVDRAVQGVTDAGANSVSNIQFTVDNPETFLAQARADAMKEARAKAESSASLAGAKLGAVTSINEYLSGPVPTNFGYYDTSMGKGGAVTTPGIEPGSNELELTVNVTYSLV